MSAVTRIFIALLLLAISREGVAADRNEDLKMNIEYFQHVNLNCTNGGDDAINVQFWILPSGEILHPPNERSGNVRINSNGTALEIVELDDVNFGLYICVIQTENKTTVAFVKGINVDGPYYGEDTVNEFKRKAVVGGISAGVVFGLITIVCLLTSICKHGKKTDTEKGRPGDMNEVVKETSQSKTSPAVTLTITPDTDPAEHSATKIDDSIYDTADNLLPSMPNVDTNHVTEVSVGKDEESVPSESGHYTSIGSLERDLKPYFGVENDTENDRTSIDLKPDEPNTPEEEFQVDEHCASMTIDDPVPRKFNDIEDSENQMNEKQSEVNSNDDNHVSDEPNDISVTSADGTQDDGKPIYAKPMKRRERQTDMVNVVVVQGEVIIEPNGISVPVTTVSTVSTPISDGVPATSEMFRSNGQESYLDGVEGDNASVGNESGQDPNVIDADVTDLAETACEKTAALDTLANTDETNGSPSSKSGEVNKDTDHESASNGKKHTFSSVSSSCSETSKSTVDDETIAHFENVLASLVGTRKTKSVSSLSNESDKDPDAASSTDSGQDDRL